MLNFLKTRIDWLISFQTQLKLKIIVLKILDKLGVNDLFRLICKKGLLILMYHGIVKEMSSLAHRSDITMSVFEEQLKYLKRKKYKFITLTDWLDIFEHKKKLKNNYIILTFDDGFKDVIEYAYPLMKKLSVKGCFYIVSEITGNNKLIWTDYLDVFIRSLVNSKLNFEFKGQNVDYPLLTEHNILRAINDIKDKLRNISYNERNYYLSKFNTPNNVKHFQSIPKEYLIVNWEDLKKLDKNILEIGSHTKTHPNLDTLKTEEDFKEELKESKVEIEGYIGYRIKHLSYPAGAYNEEVINYVKRYGYLTGVTVEPGFNSLKTNLYRLKRVKIDNELVIFKYKISGLYYFIKKNFFSKKI